MALTSEKFSLILNYFTSHCLILLNVDNLTVVLNFRWQFADCRALGVPVTEHSYEDGEVELRVTELSLTPIARLANLNMLLRQAG